MTTAGVSAYPRRCMAGRYPEPSSQTQNRNRPAFDWTILPAEGRLEPAPPMPTFRDFKTSTIEWWARLWSSPEATQWDQSGRTLERLAILHHQLVLDDDLPVEKSRAATISAEMRAIEDRHGLSPKSKLQLRWMVAKSLPGALEGGTVLQLVPDDEESAEPIEEPDEPAGPVVPKARDGKPLWIAWAVSCGAEPAQAEGMTKKNLVKKYADASPGDPPRARTESSAVRKMREKMAAQANRDKKP